MSKVLSLHHIVFATLGRYPSLHDVNRLDLHRVIAGIVMEKQSKLICINSVTDHVHILLNLSPNVALSDLMVAVKAKSSKWLKLDSRTTMFDGWCTGYYACSVSPSLMQKNIRYIESQTQHHRIAFFDSEIKTMCRNMGLTFHPDDLR